MSGKKKENIKVEIADTDEDTGGEQDALSALNLSTRTENVLRDTGNTDVEALAEMSEDELAAIEGIGPKSVEEIQEALEHA